MGIGKTLHHSTLQSLQTFNQIQCVITGDLASSRDRSMRLYAGRTHFMHFCAVLNCILSQPEAACDVISVMAVQYIGMGVYAKFGDSRSKRSRDI